jgi:hypothetical protein
MALLPADRSGSTPTGSQAAHQLLVLIDGLSAERVLYPGRVTAVRQEQMLSELLGSLRRRPER